MTVLRSLCAYTHDMEPIRAKKSAAAREYKQWHGDGRAASADTHQENQPAASPIFRRARANEFEGVGVAATMASTTTMAATDPAPKRARIPPW